MTKRKEKLVAVLGADFDQAYGGTQYLLEHLAAMFEIEAHVFAEGSRRRWYAQLPFPCHVWPYDKTACHGWLFRLRFRLFRMAMQVRMVFARRVLITEAFCLREAARAKRISGRHLVLTQFCQELSLPEEYPGELWPAVQKRHAQAPDIVIDVEPLRARMRMEYYHLVRVPYVLRNTFPLARLSAPAPPGRLWELAGISPPPAGRPVLVHAGGVGREKPFARIIDAVAALDRPVFLLAFCTATDAQIQELRNYAARKLRAGSFHLGRAVPREELRASLWAADIGVVDYTFSVEPTLNQKYCAPTKLYEFMACGLAIWGSNSDTLRDVIEREGIGCCATEDTPKDLSRALDRLLDLDVPAMKARAKAVFADKYSYEKICDAEVQSLAHDILSRRI